MKRKDKTFAISMFMSKVGASRSDCINKDKIKEFSAEKIALKSGIKADLYAYTVESDPPDWLRYITPVLKSSISAKSLIKTGYSNSGVLVLEIEKSKRCAVFTFGHGKSLVKFGNLEQFFGRNVVLNSVEANKILALKSRAYDKQPRHKENQGTISSGFNEFDIDFENEILQKLTGEYPERFLTKAGFDDGEIGRKITGYDSVNFTTSLPLEDIQGLCEWLSATYESERYKKLLPDIDSFRPIKSEDLIKELNQRIVDQIKEGDLEGLHLSFPYLLDTEEYQLMSISGLGRKVIEDLKGSQLCLEDFHNALSEANKIDDLDLHALEKSYKVICFSNSDSERNRGSGIFRCISGEILLRGSTYALVDGDWYEIDKDFFEGIVRKLNKKVVTNLVDLTPYSDTDEDEYAYNQRQCNEQGYSLFDRDNVPLRGRGKVEVCDLLCKTGKLIHVKRYTASSTLSHLFSQGYVSIKSLMEDDNFQKKFLEKISHRETKTKIKSALKKRKLTVVYAILFEASSYYREDRKIENIPAFSIVNLHKFARDIETLGMSVKIQFVFS